MSVQYLKSENTSFDMSPFDLISSTILVEPFYMPVYFTIEYDYSLEILVNMISTTLKLNGAFFIYNPFETTFHCSFSDIISYRGFEIRIYQLNSKTVTKYVIEMQRFESDVYAFITIYEKLMTVCIFLAFSPKKNDSDVETIHQSRTVQLPNITKKIIENIHGKEHSPNPGRLLILFNIYCWTMTATSEITDYDILAIKNLCDIINLSVTLDDYNTRITCYEWDTQIAFAILSSMSVNHEYRREIMHIKHGNILKKLIMLLIGNYMPMAILDKCIILLKNMCNIQNPSSLHDFGDLRFWCNLNEDNPTLLKCSSSNQQKAFHDGLEDLERLQSASFIPSFASIDIVENLTKESISKDPIIQKASRPKASRPKASHIPKAPIVPNASSIQKASHIPNASSIQNAPIVPNASSIQKKASRFRKKSFKHSKIV